MTDDVTDDPVYPGSAAEALAHELEADWLTEQEAANDDTDAECDTAVEDERSVWLRWRRGGIGGSDIGALLGLSNYASPWSLWADKVGLLPADEQSQRQRIGHRMEAVLADEFHDDTGLWVIGAQTWCQHPDHPEFRCTVDGFVAEHPQVTDRSLMLGTWQAKTDARYAWPDDEPPPAIRAQCVWEMGVVGLEHCWLTVMFGGFRLHTYEIDWDADARGDWELMVDRAGRFWHEHVVTGIPPAVDGSDATAAALRTVYPDHTPGEHVDITDLADLVAERAELKATERATGRRLKQIDNEIKAAIGDAEVASVDGAPVFTYRTSERAGYQVAPSTVRVLRTTTRRNP